MADNKSGKQRLNKKEKKIKESIPTMYKYQNENEWCKVGERLLNYFNGRHYIKNTKTSRFTYNSIFSNVQTLIPNLVLNNPKIMVKPQTPKYIRENIVGEIEQINNVESAKVMESAINHEYRKIKAIDETRKAIFDPLFWGFGVLKTGYSFKTMTEENEDYVLEDSVFMKRVNPKDFGFHPIATGVHDSPLLSQRIVTKKSALEQNENYKNVDSISPSLPKHLQDKMKSTGKDDNCGEHDYVTIWEVHDQEDNMIYTYGGEEKLLLWKRKREYSHNGSDFCILRFANEPDEFLGVPLLLMIEDEQKGMNEVLTLMINHLHMFPGRVWVEEGMVDDDDLVRIEEGGQGAVQQIKALDKVKFQNPLTMGSDYLNVLNTLQSLSDRTLAIPDFLKSANTQRKSASESAFIKSDVDIKRQYLGNIVKNFMLDSIDNIGYLMQEFYDRNRYAFAFGGIDFKHVEYNKDDIKGQYQYDFDIDSLQASNQSQVQELINALNVIAAHPALAPILQTMDPIKLGTEIFRKMNMNIESYQIKEIENIVFIDPQKENLIAISPEHKSVEKFGGIIPDPKPNEDHDYHLETHMKVSQELALIGQRSQELERHVALTLRLKEKQEQLKAPSAPMPQGPGQGQGSPNGPGPQPTPSGPVNLPGQAMANRIRPQ